MARLPSIEEFADKTGFPLRRVVKGALLRLAPVFRSAITRRELLLNQRYVCPICEGERGPLVDSGKETHVDHKWTTDQAANAVLDLDGTMDLISAHQKLWAPENLQAVHAACNNFRRKKKEAMEGHPLAN